MQSINSQFDLIRQSATVAMADRILALKASGKNIVGLQVGDPDFGTHPAIADAAMKAIQSGLTHYGPSRGYPDLRAAVANKLTSRRRHHLRPRLRNSHHAWRHPRLLPRHAIHSQSGR